MINSVTSTENYCVNFNICTNDEKGLLWIEVVIYEKGHPRTTKDFTGNDYGKALNYYRKQQTELKEKYKQ